MSPTVTTHYTGARDRELEAFKRLKDINAELLAACVRAEEVLDGSLRTPQRERALEAVRAAIAKAEHGG